METTTNATHRIYELAKLVYANDLSLSEAKALADDEELMAQSSAGNYINNYKMMMHGREYQWAMNIYSTEYFLRKIRDEAGEDQFRLALDSCRKHFRYYDKTHGGKPNQQPTLRKLVDNLAKTIADIKPHSLYPDEIDTKATYHEGAKKTVTVNSHERNRDARTACINHHGATCQACDTDLGEFYGPIGEGFIHVHHKKDLSLISGPYEVDPVNDLIPVCPNCHAMLHQETPAMTVEELRRRIQEANT